MQELPMEAADHFSGIDSLANMVLLVAGSSVEKGDVTLDGNTHASKSSETSASSILRY